MLANTAVMYKVKGKIVYLTGKDGENEKNNSPGQQKKQITGRVVDKDGFPLPGVSITVKGKKGIGTVTDVDGLYKITCDSEEVLVFTYVGHTPHEEKAETLDRVTITLKDDTVALEEVQVVAFGKQKKESVVSSISAVTPKELRVPSSNLTAAFAGRMAGIIAYQRSGEPGLITSFSSGLSPILALAVKRTR